MPETLPAMQDALLSDATYNPGDGVIHGDAAYIGEYIMQSDTYNGWTNYETWNYKLWIDNDLSYYMDIAEDLANDPTIEASDVFTAKENHTFKLADALKEQCESDLEQWMPEQSGPFADILNAGISQINWFEIADSLLESVSEAA